jgi:uncharacterized protein (TIGR01777 family)
MKITISGATGLIGSRLVAALRGRGDDVTVLSRDAERARRELGVPAVAWRPEEEPAPAAALAGRDAAVHLAGAGVSQRWTDQAKRAIRDSRVIGTANLVAGIEAADPRPGALVSGSAVGFYGAHGSERVDERTPAGDDFLARVVVGWEAAAQAVREHGLRVVLIRTGVVLDRRGGALAQMLMPFRLGIGGPVAGGDQYMPWIHLDDEVGIILAALDDAGWDGPVNASAPEPATNADFSHALGRALHRPAILPVPGFALALLYGEMAQVVTTGQRAVPSRALEHGYRFAHGDLDEALRSALA